MNTMIPDTTNDLRVLLCPTPSAFTNGFENPMCFADCAPSETCPLTLGQSALESTVTVDAFATPTEATTSQRYPLAALPGILIAGL